MVNTVLWIAVGVASIGLVAVGLRGRSWRKKYLYLAKELRHQKADLHQRNLDLEKALTTLERREEMLDKRNKKLIEMNRLKTKLFTVISHDMRSPLATVIGLLDLLREGKMSQAEVKEYASKATLRVQSTYEMLTNLLYWSRNQMMGMELNAKQMNVEKVITEVLGVYQPIAQNKGVVVEKEIYAPVNVYADPEMVHMVLRNLISNAIKFTPPGGTVSISEVSMEDYVSIAVRDTGIGMDANTKANLFSSQVSSTLGTNQEKGTGLGLSLCKEFVNKNGGRISVESGPGEGTVFRFTLPLTTKSLQEVA